MNILLVKPYENDNYSYKALFDQVLKVKEKNQVDLVVFPNGFSTVESREEAWDFIRYTSHLVKAPVICGFTLYDGSEQALYVNGAPAIGETSGSLFVNHSTVTNFAFGMYQDVVDGVKPNEPILLNSCRIQVHIGQEMVSLEAMEKWAEEGVNILIHLTDGDGEISEWCDVLKEQSAKLDVTVLGSFVSQTNKQQPSSQIGFRSGMQLTATDELDTEEKAHAFRLFSIDVPILEE